MARQSRQNCDSFESIKNIVLGVIHVLMWKIKISRDDIWLSGPSLRQENGTETRETLSNSGWNDCQVPGTKQLKQMSLRRTKKRAASLGHSAVRTRKTDRIREKPVLNTIFILCVWTCEEECAADDGAFTLWVRMQKCNRMETALWAGPCVVKLITSRKEVLGLWFRVFS